MISVRCQRCLHLIFLVFFLPARRSSYILKGDDAFDILSCIYAGLAPLHERTDVRGGCCGWRHVRSCVMDILLSRCFPSSPMSRDTLPAPTLMS